MEAQQIAPIKFPLNTDFAICAARFQVNRPVFKANRNKQH